MLASMLVEVDDRSGGCAQVLVGPSDWREGQAAAGRTGTVTGRYHVQNVPAMEFGPGVFELGVTAPSWAQRAQNSLKKEDVIPVYVGQAANIRHRLHKFGQAAAHPDPTSRSCACSNTLWIMRNPDCQ